MIAYLTKSDASKGFNQIIDFLNGSSINYALIVNPNIYVSCIKQFWTSVAVKKVNDITRLQALVDKKKVVIMEASIRDSLCLDDAEGVECLPNEEIFIELARMGYEKPSTKLTFYKALFSIQWKVGKGFSRVETPLFKGMIVEQQVAEGADEVHDEGVPAVGVVTEGDAGDDVNVAVDEPSIPSPTPPAPPPQPSQDIPSTSQDARISMNLLQDLMDTCTTLTRRVEHLELDKIAQALKITKLKQRVKKLERRNKLTVLKLRRLKRVGSAQRIDTSNDTVMDDVSKQRGGGIIANIDADKGVVLEDAKDVTDDARDDQDADVEDNADIQEGQQKSKPAEIQEVVDVVTTAKIITEVVTAASTTITAADVLISAATTAAAPTFTAAPSRWTKGVVIRDLEESASMSTIIHSEAKSKDKDHVQRKQKQDKTLKRYQALKRKPQTEAQAKKNMMIYLRNVVGFKKDYFKRIEIALEKKIKHLDNIVYKRDQSAQTVHMLRKLKFFYDHTTKQALGFQNHFYLKKAQQLEPKLYDGNIIKNTCAIVIPDSEETLMLAKESHSKMILK
nr:hypothetical protein [Tanacetum cinerariifolium]